MTGLLAALERDELDELIALAEHAERIAHVALVNAPLRSDALAAACGVVQDCAALLHDCYDASMLLHAAAMDRLLLVGPAPYVPPGEARCNAPCSHNGSCNAAAGHGGQHATYGHGGDGPYCTWDRS